MAIALYDIMRLFLTILTCSLSFVLSGQEYLGTAVSDGDNYAVCELKLNGDGALYIAGKDTTGAYYFDIVGRMEFISDEMRVLHASGGFRAWGGSGYSSDTMRIVYKSDRAPGERTIVLRYSDGYKQVTHFKANDCHVASDGNINRRTYSWCIAIDKGHAKYQYSIDPITGATISKLETAILVEFGHKNPITGDPVEFTARSFEVVTIDDNFEKNYFISIKRDSMRIFEELSFINPKDVPQSVEYDRPFYAPDSLIEKRTIDRFLFKRKQ